MARAFNATDARLERQLVVKVLSPELAASHFAFEDELTVNMLGDGWLASPGR